MNLKSKLQHKATAVVKIISDTQCIFSDEISNTHKNALQILTADNKQELWSLIQSTALSTASSTKFAPTILIITETEELNIYKMPKQPQQPAIKEYDPNA